MQLNAFAINVMFLDGPTAAPDGAVQEAVGFFVAVSDAAGTRIESTETQLVPGPIRVEYPVGPLGQLVPTADNRVIQQQYLQDGRQRTWIWSHNPANNTAYKALWALLEPMRSAARSQRFGITPYVWVKDTVTNELRRQVIATGTATSGTSATLVHTGAGWTPDAFVNYEIEIIAGTGLGQTRPVVKNTIDTITVGYPWSPTPNATSQYAIHGWVNDWFRARVLQVSRVPQSDRVMTFEETRFSFIVQDPAFNYLG